MEVIDFKELNEPAGIPHGSCPSFRAINPILLIDLASQPVTKIRVSKKTLVTGQTMPIGVTLNGVLRGPLLDPEREQRVEEEVIAFVAIEDVFGVQRLEGLLHGGGGAEPKLFAKRLRIEVSGASSGHRL